MKAFNVYQSMDERDQLAIKIFSVFFAVLVMFYGVLGPARQFHQKAQQHYQTEIALNDWLQQQAAAVQRLGSSGKLVNGGHPGATNADRPSALTLVNSGARNHQLTIKRLQPEKNGDLRIWLESANFTQTIQWLRELEQKGIAVADITLDQQAPGKVNVRARFVELLR